MTNPLPRAGASPSPRRGTRWRTSLHYRGEGWRHGQMLAIPPQLDLYQRGLQAGLARGPGVKAA
jgi:hypothetical protein